MADFDGKPVKCIESDSIGSIETIESIKSLERVESVESIEPLESIVLERADLKKMRFSSFGSVI